jgi:hypothetical protein
LEISSRIKSSDYGRYLISVAEGDWKWKNI